MEKIKKINNVNPTERHYWEPGHNDICMICGHPADYDNIHYSTCLFCGDETGYCNCTLALKRLNRER